MNPTCRLSRARAEWLSLGADNPTIAGENQEFSTGSPARRVGNAGRVTGHDGRRTARGAAASRSTHSWSESFEVFRSAFERTAVASFGKQSGFDLDLARKDS
ncbi:hypothetical protein GCM10027436_68620 [Actinophytocola sediminis]